MERVFADGMAKGIIKGSGEIAHNLAYLSKLTGGDQLFTGTQGAQQMLTMNNAIAGATSLSSVNDILTYRAASRALNESTKTPDGKWTLTKDAQALRKAIGYDARNGYVNNQILLERGFDPTLLKYQMRMVKSTEGGREGQIERVRQMFGFNYTTSENFLDYYNKNREAIESGRMRPDEVKQWVDKYVKPEDYDDPHKQYIAKQQELIRSTVKLGTAQDVLTERMKAMAGVIQDVNNRIGVDSSDTARFTKSDIGEALYGFYDTTNGKESELNNRMKNVLSAAFASGDPLARDSAQKVIGALTVIPDAQREKWNAHNSLNNVTETINLENKDAAAMKKTLDDILDTIKNVTLYMR
jgi:hypothetical protein